MGDAALDELRLDYAVSWPLNLIIDGRSLELYNQILIFLLQVSPSSLIKAFQPRDQSNSRRRSRRQTRPDILSCRQDSLIFL